MFLKFNTLEVLESENLNFLPFIKPFKRPPELQDLKVMYLNGKYTDLNILCWSIIYFEDNIMILNIRFDNSEQPAYGTSLSLDQNPNLSLVYVFKIVYDCLQNKDTGILKAMGLAFIFVRAAQLWWLANSCDWCQNNAEITINYSDMI